MIKTNKLMIWLGVVVAVLGMTFIGWMVWWFNRNSGVEESANNHAVYAALYEAAWREDQAQGNTVVTATLLTPVLRQALKEDPMRSGTDEQIWRVVANQSDTLIALAVTYDSTAGTLTDQQFIEKFALSAASGGKYTAVSWTPIISTSKVVNAPVETKSQMGVLTFVTDQVVNWDNIRDLKLVGTKIGDQDTRTFTWARPATLSGE